MKLHTGIKYMDYHIPANIISVDEVLSLNKERLPSAVENFDQYVANFKTESGLDRISILDTKDNIASIASEMVAKLFKVTDVKPEEIKYLVCGNASLMEDNISTIHYIKKKFHLNNASILPIFQPCASSVIAMGISSGLLSGNKKEYMLVLTARVSADIKGRYAGFMIMGDGLALVLIENHPEKIKLTNWCSYNNGQNSYNKMEDPENQINVTRLQMNIIGNGVFFLQNTLIENGINIHNIDKIMQPNTNKSVFEKLYSSMLKIEPEKFSLENMAYGGHINDVDLVRNTKDYLDQLQNNGGKASLLIYGIDLVQSLDVNYHAITVEV